MLISTWNVNSVRQRLAALVGFLRETAPDVLLLQETKCEDHNFPRMEVEDAGYNVAIHGQKTFNGVAILSKTPIDDVVIGLPGFDGEAQSRYIEALVGDGEGGVARVASIYAPNGNPPDTPKYSYKLRFMEALTAHAKKMLALEETLILAGDYNVIPAPRDVYDANAWAGDALFLPQTRFAWQRMQNLGMTDALRAVTDEAGLYTFWDYQAGAWQKNKGLRIDHLLLSPRAADRLESVVIHKELRAGEKPSDHVAISARLAA